MKTRFRDKALIVPVILLFFYLVFRLIDTSAMINNFPFDYANDLSAHLAKLFFLNNYGFYDIIPYWYNGFNYTLFQSYPPGYYYAALPLLKIIKDVQLAGYISLLLIYIFGFIAVYFLLKDLSRIRRIALYLFFFANPISIGYLLRLGKLPEMTGWLLNLIIFGILIYYKDRPLDKKFLFFIPSYAASLLSNVSSFIVMSPLILGFSLIKTKKEKVYIFLSILISLIITSFWWIPFYKSSLTKSLGTEAIYTQWLIENAPNQFFTYTNDKLTAVLSSLLLIVLLYLYWKGNNSKKDLLFFLPIAIEAFLIFITPLTKAIVFIPVYNRPPVDTFNIGFLLISSYLFLRTEFPLKIKKVLEISLTLLIIISIIVSFSITPMYQKVGNIERETFELLPLVKGNFLVLENNTNTYNSSYSRAYYSYAPIYYNLTTVSGWIDQTLTVEDERRISRLTRDYRSFTSKEVLAMAMDLNVKSIIMYNEDCDVMEEFSAIIKKTQNTCLFYI